MSLSNWSLTLAPTAGALEHDVPPPLCAVLGWVPTLNGQGRSLEQQLTRRRFLCFHYGNQRPRRQGPRESWMRKHSH
jgi:hypothetical protein